MLLALALQLLLSGAFSEATAIVSPDEGPTASLLCAKDSVNKVACTVTAQVPNPKRPPQYTWIVSAGRLEGNGTPNITVDTTETKSQSVVVTVAVRWPDCTRICNRSLSQTVPLERRSR
jgi:hypothetical protein